MAESAIAPSLVALNLASYEGIDELVDVLFDGTGADAAAYAKRKHIDAIWGRLQRIYREPAASGWYFRGWTWDADAPEVVVLKGDHPRKGYNGKPIKYEVPPGVPLRLFLARIPREIWEKVAERAGKPIPADAPTSGDCSEEFWTWVRNCNISLTIVEGVKKALALLSIGIVAIGINGINCAYQCDRDERGKMIARRLREDMLPLATPGRRIDICFDQDEKPKTRRAVASAIHTTARLLKLCGCDPHVVEWQQALGKGIDDVAYAHGTETVEELFDAAKPYRHWKTTRLADLTHPTDREFNCRYLPELDVADDERLICLKSLQGTGKTQQIEALVARAHAENRRVLMLTHRVQLGQALGDRCGIPYVTERLQYTDAMGFALCIDSLHQFSSARFDPESWRGCLVVIDEIEQVLWHLLSANTDVKKRRAIVIANLMRLLQVCGRCVIADADLSDLSVDFVCKVMGSVTPWVARNDYQFQGDSAFDAILYDGSSPAALWQQAEALAGEGKRLLVQTSGQKAKSAWGTQTLERKLAKRYPERRILRIDADTIADPDHPAFGITSHLNEKLTDWDIVIVSPVLETGVSIDIAGHFDAVFAIAWGNQTADAVVQSIHRLRDSVPRHIWAKEKAIQKVANGATTPAEVRKGNRRALEVTCRSLGISDIEMDAIAYHTWACFAARINQAANAYRETIQVKLEAKGHHVRHADEPDAAAAKEMVSEVKALRDTNYEAECEAIASASDISENELEELVARKKKTEVERHQERKAKLKQRYELPVTPELVKQDDKGFYAQIRLHFNLTAGREFVEDRDRHTLQKRRETSGALDWGPDVVGSTAIAKVLALEALNVPALLQWAATGALIGNHTQETLALLEKVKTCRNDVRAILGNIPAEKPIACLKAVLRLIGVQVERAGRQGWGDRQYLYRIVIPDDGRDRIFETWYERELEKARKRLEPDGSHAQQLPPAKPDPSSSKGYDPSSSRLKTLGIKEIRPKGNPPTHSQPNNAGCRGVSDRVAWCLRWLVETWQSAPPDSRAAAFWDVWEWVREEFSPGKQRALFAALPSYLREALVATG